MDAGADPKRLPHCFVEVEDVEQALVYAARAAEVVTLPLREPA